MYRTWKPTPDRVKELRAIRDQRNQRNQLRIMREQRVAQQVGSQGAYNLQNNIVALSAY